MTPGYSLGMLSVLSVLLLIARSLPCFCLPFGRMDDSSALGSRTYHTNTDSDNLFGCASVCRPRGPLISGLGILHPEPCGVRRPQTVGIVAIQNTVEFSYQNRELSFELSWILSIEKNDTSLCIDILRGLGGQSAGSEQTCSSVQRDLVRAGWNWKLGGCSSASGLFPRPSFDR